MFIILLTLAIILLGVALYFFLRYRRLQVFFQSLQKSLILVRLPLENPEGKDFKKEMALMEQFLGTLVGLKQPIVFEAAVPYIGEEIYFYVAAPRRLIQSLIRQINAVWDKADVKITEDYNIFNSSGVSIGAYLKQKERFILPIRTYNEAEADTFVPILGGLSQIKEFGEGGAIQFIVKTAGTRAKKEIRSALKVLKKGWSLKEVLSHPFKISFSDFVEAFKAKNKKEGGEEAKVVDEQAVKALEEKTAKPLFEVNVRIFASAYDAAGAESLFQSLATGFSQFGAPVRNEFTIVRPRDPSQLIYQFSFREFNPEQSMILNAEELASIFHFPTAFTTIPKIKYLKAREAPPPPILPREGVIIGKSVFRGEEKEVRISDEDRRRHVYIIGQTGTGKSNLITNMVVQDIRLGKGVALIDPHGDLVNDTLSLIPKNRFDDVIIFDPSDFDYPLGLNMLEYNFNRPEEKTFIVNEMQSIFNKLFPPETMGPMFEQYMRNALLLLMEDMPNEPATLMEVPRVFTDFEFRRRKLERIKNPTVIDFWEKEAIKAGGEAALSNMTPYITSKFNNFTANDYVRVIIGQTRSAVRFREIMDEGKILLINLVKGKIGDLNAYLLGMIMVGKLLMAAFGRVDVPQEKRRDFNLFIDEFQNFSTDSISTILSEARKYRLNLVVAHQFIAQLEEKIRDAVFGNVGSMIVFRVGAQDAEFLKKQFEPTFTEQDLINIDNFNAYVKLLISGATSPPFNLKTLPSEKGSVDFIATIKEISRLKYGTLRQEVENEILRRLRT
jgi:hypothetical protein